jgi:hypothetical protein
MKCEKINPLTSPEDITKHGKNMGKTWENRGKTQVD